MEPRVSGFLFAIKVIVVLNTLENRKFLRENEMPDSAQTPVLNASTDSIPDKVEIKFADLSRDDRETLAVLLGSDNSAEGLLRSMISITCAVVRCADGAGSVDIVREKTGQHVNIPVGFCHEARLEEIVRPQLTIKLDRASGVFCVSDIMGRHVAFPPIETIREAWASSTGGAHLIHCVGAGHTGPRLQMEVAPGTKGLDREVFCRKLSEECTLA